MVLAVQQVERRDLEVEAGEMFDFVSKTHMSDRRKAPE
jgi:hypothetical protein